METIKQNWGVNKKLQTKLKKLVKKMVAKKYRKDAMDILTRCTDKTLREEIIANVSGLASMEAVEMFLALNNRKEGLDKNSIKALYNNLSPLQNEINNGFKAQLVFKPTAIGGIIIAKITNINNITLSSAFFNLPKIPFFAIFLAKVVFLVSTFSSFKV
jgi:hypothetical protein